MEGREMRRKAGDEKEGCDDPPSSPPWFGRSGSKESVLGAPRACVWRAAQRALNTGSAAAPGGAVAAVEGLKPLKINFRARSLMVLKRGKGGTYNPGVRRDGGRPGLGLFASSHGLHLHCHGCGWDIHRSASSRRGRFSVAQGRSSRRLPTARTHASQPEFRDSAVITLNDIS